MLAIAAATWVSAEDQFDRWTQQFFPAGAQPGSFIPFPNNMPNWARATWQAPAPPVDLAAPWVTVLEDTVASERRTLRLRATSPRGAPNLNLDIQARGGIEAALDGKPLDLSTVPADQRTRLRIAYHAVPAEGIGLGVTIAALGPVHVRLEDRSNELPVMPGMTISARPADMMQAPFEMADPTIVTRSMGLSV